MLPKSPIGSESKQHVADYVELVMNRTSKAKALEEVYPERYKRALDRSPTEQVKRANIQKEINQIERSKYAQELFSAADKMWWVKFLEKKHDVYGVLYDIATSDEEETKDRISASKALLQYMPSAPKEDKLEITHKVQGDDFKQRLNEMKKQIHNTANNSEAIDAEIAE